MTAKGYLVVMLLAAYPAGAAEDAPIAVQFDISKVKAGEKVAVDSYCMDVETLKAVATEKQQLLADLAGARQDGIALKVAIGVLGIVAGGAAVFALTKK